MIHTNLTQEMNMTFRKGNFDDLNDLKLLAIKSWSQFQAMLTSENWTMLHRTLDDNKTYNDLLEQSDCFVCTTDQDNIIGMAFLVSSGNPTDIYDRAWSYIRFVSVDPDFRGMGIGRKLTKMCVELAKSNNEKYVALHTSEMMDKARHIYETMGFKILKEIDPRLGKKYWVYILEL